MTEPQVNEKDKTVTFKGKTYRPVAGKTGSCEGCAFALASKELTRWECVCLCVAADCMTDNLEVIFVEVK